MANKYGVNADYLLVDNPPDKATPGDGGGDVHCIYDTYELTADLGSGDVIYLGSKIPAGARIIDARLMFDDLDASGGTVDLGWQASDAGGEAADTDGFMDGIDVTTAGSYSTFEDAPSRPGLGKRFSEPVQAVLTTDGDTDATTGTIQMWIMYTLA